MAAFQIKLSTHSMHLDSIRHMLRSRGLFLISKPNLLRWRQSSDWVWAWQYGV